ncbi:MAG: hypothetical protein R3A45_02360 [Bdellovibrionota bacterium]
MQTIDNGSHAQKTLKACNIIHGQEVFSDTNTLTSKNPANIHDIVAIAPTSTRGYWSAYRDMHNARKEHEHSTSIACVIWHLAVLSAKL